MESTHSLAMSNKGSSIVPKSHLFDKAYFKMLSTLRFLGQPTTTITSQHKFLGKFNKLDSPPSQAHRTCITATPHQRVDFRGVLGVSAIQRWTPRRRWWVSSWSSSALESCQVVSLRHSTSLSWMSCPCTLRPFLASHNSRAAAGFTVGHAGRHLLFS
jgi:hypothetical protein